MAEKVVYEDSDIVVVRKDYLGVKNSIYWVQVKATGEVLNLIGKAPNDWGQWKNENIIMEEDNNG